VSVLKLLSRKLTKEEKEGGRDQNLNRPPKNEKYLEGILSSQLTARQGSSNIFFSKFSDYFTNWHTLL
jgi:hypothetical protein